MQAIRTRTLLVAIGVVLTTTVTWTSSPVWARPAPAGISIDYDYDASDIGKPDWAWHGRAYLPPAVTAQPSRPRPLVIFLHGVNPSFTRFFWMGGGSEPDVRVWLDEIIDSGSIEPPVLAAPSSDHSCTLPQALFTGFDLDRFLDRTLRATRGKATIDLSRVILVGHSGAGCNRNGGLMSALRGSVAPRAALVIDVCMDPYDAPGFALGRPGMDLVVTWQSSWDRNVKDFEARLLEESAARGAVGMRLVQEMEAEQPNAHERIVERSLQRWLPVWIPSHPDQR